ncbi:DUF7919 family protein [Propionibacterium australiense]|uniref:DUF7919 family protein n=1 Tax=Propionibacterium australiense TaxID=119981 RepID=UPI0040455B12
MRPLFHTAVSGQFAVTAPAHSAPHKGVGPTRHVSDRGEWRLGDRSVAVTDDEGHLWAAPDLVLHYMTEHDYGPGFTMHPAPIALVRALDRQCPELILRV